MTVDVTATFPLNVAETPGLAAAVKLAADKKGFIEAAALRAELRCPTCNHRNAIVTKR
jgi:hypothetical protein